MTMTRRKTPLRITVVKSWMVVSETGHTRLEDLGKQSIMKRTGLPARDLRVLDPMLSHPSSIFGRDRAIVVNLEHVKAIITATEVLTINSSNPFFLTFIQDLQFRLPNEQVCNDEDGGDKEKPLLLKGSASFCGPDDSKNGLSADMILNTEVNETRMDSPKNDAENAIGTPVPKQLPFEFKALEACIESACRCLESETSTLEEEAYPALDELTSELSTLNLERVRQIKSRLVALSGRVQKVAGQLEHLLDDDNDMAEMYLTLKHNSRFMDQASPKEGYNSEFEDDDQRDESDSEMFDKFPGPKLEIAELEMLLEAYFAQTDGILQKLTSLSEYVGDTEDYINIMLDDKRNQLLQGAIMFNTLNVILNAGIVVVGLFGMNVSIQLFDGKPSSKFWAVASGTFAGCIIIVLFSFWWGKERYLLSQ
ncbi:hypothetical protein RJT34_03096 [Clitoria ternatea]|uniref:Magnesium transporter n=1 Tax=Clitoria ternatea TaxID=43366 RepID=A0AAN9Q0X3_CLITE